MIKEVGHLFSAEKRQPTKGDELMGLVMYDKTLKKREGKKEALSND